MRALEALLSIGSYTGSLFPGLPGKPPKDVLGLKLTHVVVPQQGIFHLNSVASSEVSELSAAAMKSRFRQIPHFKHHTDTDAVIESWLSTIDAQASTIDPLISRNDPSQWQVRKYATPDVEDKETVLTLAKIAANAYVPTPHHGDWTDVNGSASGGWHHEKDGYGWEDDGLRGYVFTSADRKVMVLSVKGTSTAVLDSGGPTAPNDKINDNLFFSCCCARVSYMWQTVCDCYMGDGQCDEVCLERELIREDRYYREILDVLQDARELVPEASTIWITGHSLGGSLSSMLGRTYGLPVVTFEAPGEALPVRRLHLPVPPGLPPWEDHVWHFGHNADPIFVGSCSGHGSTCSMKGYAMETSCHSGQVCVYDVKNDLGWHESVVNHRIHVVIDNVLEVYDNPAVCRPPEPCEDCSSWTFIDPFDLPEPEPEPEPSTKPSKTPKTSTTTSTARKTNTKSSKHKPTATSSPAPTATMTSSCVSRAWYGKCESWTTFPDAQPTSTSEPSSSCVKRNWLGQCELWTSYPLQFARTAFATS